MFLEHADRADQAIDLAGKPHENHRARVEGLLGLTPEPIGATNVDLAAFVAEANKVM